MYIANGTDDLTLYDGSTLSQYSGLTTPTGLGLTRGSGLSAGSYTNYYQVSAENEIGETLACTEVSTTTDIERDAWSAADEKIDLSWTAVSGAVRYNIYYSDVTGDEQFLAQTTTNSYSDTSADTVNPYIIPPTDNTTKAPKFKFMEISGNRIWGTGDPDNKWRVYYSGTGSNVGKFSIFYGGMWVDLEKGGRDTPVSIAHYRTGKGDPVATVLCSSPEGSGSLWQIGVSSITVGSYTFTIPTTYKIVGSIGTNAPLSTVKAKDNIGFGNKKGFFLLRNKEQLFNVLSTDEASQAIRSEWRSLNGANIDKMCAYYYDGKIFISVPEGTENSAITILDMERNNWSWKWTFGVKRFLNIQILPEQHIS